MFDPEQFNSENDRIWWPAIFTVLAVQMIVLIALSIAVTNHSSFATAPTDIKANSTLRGSPDPHWRPVRYPPAPERI